MMMVYSLCSMTHFGASGDMLCPRVCVCVCVCVLVCVSVASSWSHVTSTENLSTAWSCRCSWA